MPACHWDNILPNLEMIKCCVRIDHRWWWSQLTLETCYPYKCMFGGTNGFPCSFSTSGESRFPVSFFSWAQGHRTIVVSTNTHTCSNLQFLCFVRLVKALEYPAFFIGKPEGSYDRPEETPETSLRVNLALTWQPVSLTAWQELDTSFWAPLITILSSLWLLCHLKWYYLNISSLNCLSFNWQQQWEHRFSECTNCQILKLYAG